MKRLIAAAFAALAGTPLAATAGDLTVSVDRPGRYTLPEGVARIFVADPLIADIQVVNAELMLVIGKMPGQADIVLMDANAQRLDTLRVRVGNDRAGVVTLYNGPERFSFRCADRCEQVPMLGDGDLASLTELITNARLRGAPTAQGGIGETVVEVPQTEPQAPSAPAEPAS